MIQSYCEKWFRTGKRAIGPMAQELARELHKARKPYAAVLESHSSGRQVVSISPPWVSVVFLDEQLREYLTYDFNEVEPGRLFLKMATQREYEGVSDDPVLVRRCAFDVQGSILAEQKDLRTGEVWERETHDSLEENWETFPRFGDYEAICRKERSPVGLRPE